MSHLNGLAGVFLDIDQGRTGESPFTRSKKRLGRSKMVDTSSIVSDKKPETNETRTAFANEPPD
ncbi:MAG: hypothetical protein P1U42_03205 [Phycisphaerales bacterium]|nr:hypothetical protein [Phycisphaerales bacterium]